jgi:uncharacterized protein (TIGR02678 family)
VTASSDASALTDAVDAAQIDDRRRALRALLRRPLLTAADPAFPLVRRHAAELREWLVDEAGWTLTVDAEVARLRKVPAPPVDATRPALAPRTARPFERRRYVLLCLALAVLERSEAQITLGRLADRILDAAADPELVAAGLAFRLETRDERGDLVAVARLLLGWRALSRVAGDEDAYLRASGDALYDVHRRVVAGLLAAPRGPSTITATGFEERLEALTAPPAARTTRIARQSLTRRLLDDPVLYLDDLPEDERAYLGHQRTVLLRRVADATGLEPEVRAEGIALLDPTGEATDMGIPEEGTEGHVTLLLAEYLAGLAGPAGAGPGSGSEAPDGLADTGPVPVPVAVIEAHTAELAVAHGQWWSRPAREPGAERWLCAQALDRLEGHGLIRRTAAGVEPRPALARFAVGAPRLQGGTG